MNQVPKRPDPTKSKHPLYRRAFRCHVIEWRWLDDKGYGQWRWECRCGHQWWTKATQGGKGPTRHEPLPKMFVAKYAKYWEKPERGLHGGCDIICPACKKAGRYGGQ